MLTVNICVRDVLISDQQVVNLLLRWSCTQEKAAAPREGLQNLCEGLQWEPQLCGQKGQKMVGIARKGIENKEKYHYSMCKMVLCT